MCSRHQKIEMSTSPFLLPCLAFHSVENQSTVLFSAAEKKPIAGGSNIGDLENKIICPTTHGFMLARDPSSLATFLWSPQSRRKIELPPLGLEIEDDLLVDCTCLLLSDKPTAPGCVVLLVQPDAPSIWYCSAGECQWTKHEYDIGIQPALPEWDLPEVKVLITPIAACRGKFYFNGTAGSLGVIDMCPAPVFSSITTNDTMDESYEGGGASLFFVEADDELYMVSLFSAANGYEPYTYTRATVHRMDFSEQQWCEAGDLGGRMFLLSPYEFGASCSGGKAGGLQQDCVYFVNPRNNTLQVFNVKDGSMETQKLDDAPVSDKAFWVLPTDDLLQSS